jgi:cytochrome c-550 PedF
MQFEDSGMHDMMKPIGLAVGLFLGAIGMDVLAHGDVTPHPIDTTGLQQLGKELILPNPFRGNEKAVAIGAVGYSHNCAGCHGLNAVVGGVAPDLLLLAKDCLGIASKDKQAACLNDSDDYFQHVVLKGKKNADGRFLMPAYESVFTQEAVWALKAYIDSRAIEDLAKEPK